MAKIYKVVGFGTVRAVNTTYGQKDVLPLKVLDRDTKQELNISCWLGNTGESAQPDLQAQDEIACDLKAYKDNKGNQRYSVSYPKIMLLTQREPTQVGSLVSQSQEAPLSGTTTPPANAPKSQGNGLSCPENGKKVSKYTPEEIAEFKAKERRMVRMNSLAHATEIVKTHPYNNPIKAITNIAEVLEEWIYRPIAETEFIPHNEPVEESGNQHQKTYPDSPEPVPNKLNDNAYKAMIDKFAEMKKQLGDEAYYKLLGENGFEHANQIPHLPDGNKILSLMRSLVRDKVNRKGKEVVAGIIKDVDYGEEKEKVDF